MHSDETISKFFRTLTADREAGIDRIMATDPDCPHRFMAAMKWDMEHAPKSNNWEMLNLIGVYPEMDPLDDIIKGLAKWGVYLTGTNHLTDAELHTRLLTSVLVDPVTMVPPNPDMSEFISMTGNIDDDDHLREEPKAVSDRDATLPRPEHHDPGLSPSETAWMNQILSASGRN